MRRLRLDWKQATLFVFALGFLLAVILLGWVSVNSAHDRDRAFAGWKEERAVAARDRATAAEERADNRSALKDLQERFDERLAQDKALLVYLRTRGIHIPAELIPAEASGSDTVRAESDAERTRRESSAGGSPKAPSPAGQDSGSTGGSGGSSDGSSDSPGKSDEHRAKPQKDEPDKGNDDKPQKGGKK